MRHEAKETPLPGRIVLLGDVVDKNTYTRSYVVKAYYPR